MIPARRKQTELKKVPGFAGARETDETYVRTTAREYAQVLPWADEAAIEVNLAVHACYAAVRQADRALLNALGLGRTAGRFTVLRALYLSTARRLTQKQIANKLMIAFATVTFLIDGLEGDGLVERVAHEHDRRSTWVELTPKGQEVCARIIPAMARLAGQLSEGFSDAEKVTFLELLMRFWRNSSSDPVSKVLESPSSSV